MKHEIYDKRTKKTHYTYNKNQLYDIVFDIELREYGGVFCKPTDSDKELIRAIKGIPGHYAVIR